jgi:hypothetical protein
MPFCLTSGLGGQTISPKHIASYVNTVGAEKMIALLKQGGRKLAP